MRILVLCTGNTCRSQMAEGFLRQMHPDWEIFSAGTYPGKEVNPLAIAVMKEAGIDISAQYPKHVNNFVAMPFDYVITVCDDANEHCPVFTGKVKQRLHRGFPDPAAATGTIGQQLEIYRHVRDQIRQWLEEMF